MPYPCTWPMLFLHTVHLSCFLDTWDLFNNLFLHFAILPLPADDMTRSTQVHRLPQGHCCAEQCHHSMTSHQASKTQRLQQSHQEPGDVIWCNLPKIQTKWGQTLLMVKWLMLYRESCTGSKGGPGALIQDLLCGWPDHSSNRKGGEQKRRSFTAAQTQQHQPGFLGDKPKVHTSAANFNFGNPKVKGLEVLLGSCWGLPSTAVTTLLSEDVAGTVTQKGNQD